MPRDKSKRRAAIKQLKARKSGASRTVETAKPKAKPLAEIDDPQQQVDQAMQNLAQANPKFKRRMAHLNILDGQVVEAALPGSDVHDISGLCGLPLKRVDLQGLPLHDLSPLEGMAIEELYLENTRVKDLTPLAGMPLQRLYLSEVPVDDLSPLRDAPLVEVNLLGTKVADVAPIAQPQLHSLWLNGTQVADVKPLAAATGLISLTLADTPVASLEGLEGLKLERLHIAGTQVTDLSPVVGLPLTRLVFDLDRIETGLDEVRQMTTLREIGPSLEKMMPPAQFWAMTGSA